MEVVMNKTKTKKDLIGSLIRFETPPERKDLANSLRGNYFPIWGYPDPSKNSPRASAFSTQLHDSYDVLGDAEEGDLAIVLNRIDYANGSPETAILEAYNNDPFLKPLALKSRWPSTLIFHMKSGVIGWVDDPQGKLPYELISKPLKPIKINKQKGKKNV
jgi:hypothetical protein